MAKSMAVGAALVLFVTGVSLTSALPASAAGTTSNTISASPAPGAGSARGTYKASATATSKDTVIISLDGASSGCSISSGKVTFTGAGTCVVDFNDAGNATYAAAAEIHQSIKVYSANSISVSAAPRSGSAGGSYSPGSVATSGDAVLRTLSSNSTGCSLSSGTVTFTGLGTCHVLFNDPGNGAFAAAAQVEQTISTHSGNYIRASVAPVAGAVNATYYASATATSGDTVTITLSGTSTGCAIDKGKVTFTGNGVCRVDFNDAGNGAYAAATQVQQVITIGTGGVSYQAPLSLLTTGGSYGHNLNLISRGGSGTGAVTFAVTTIGTAGCSIHGDVLSSTRVGTCTVTVSKAGDSAFHPATSAATTVSMVAHYPKKPKAVRVGAPVWTGRSTLTSIVGAGFYGSPRVRSNAFGTKVYVTRDNGRVLTVRVKIARDARRGIHTFFIVFAHGERTSVRYNQR